MDWSAPLRLARSISNKSTPKLNLTLKSVHLPTKPEELPDLTPLITVLDYLKGGGHADIRKANLKGKNGYKVVVVKQLRRNENSAKLVHLEMRMWKKAGDHENVVQLLGKIMDSRGFPSMVAEYCEQGDLLAYTFSVARFNYKDLLLDILGGLKHVHGLNLAHGDLKPENIVLTSQSQRLVAKICDFGSARDFSSSNRISLEYTCTALYRSPELSNEEEEVLAPSFPADIWAFGCVAFVVLCKKMPYHWVKNRWTIDMFIASKKPPHSEEDKWPDSTLRRLVQSCWSDKERRPSADALLRMLTTVKPSSRTPSQRSLPPTYSTRPSPVVVQPIALPASSIPHVPDRPRVPQPYSALSLASSSSNSGASMIPIVLDRPVIVDVGTSTVQAPQIIRVGSAYPTPLSAPLSQDVEEGVEDEPSARRPRRARRYRARVRDATGSSQTRPPPHVITVSPSRERPQPRTPSPRIIQIGVGGSRRSRSRSRSPTVLHAYDSPPTSLSRPSHSPPRVINLSPPPRQSLSSLSSSSLRNDQCVLTLRPGSYKSEDRLAFVQDLDLQPGSYKSERQLHRKLAAAQGPTLRPGS
ncbi:kinase domain protein [Ceratobasidium sp. AG-Ba]|nr:kinase domain protein [Ceratobasidium sp. AG-Ba]